MSTVQINKAFEESKEIITREIKLLIEKIAKDPNVGVEECTDFFSSNNDNGRNPKNFLNVAKKNVRLEIWSVLDRFQVEETISNFERFFKKIADFAWLQEDNEEFNLSEGKSKHFSNNKDIIVNFNWELLGHYEEILDQMKERKEFEKMERETRNSRVI